MKGCVYTVCNKQSKNKVQMPREISVVVCLGSVGELHRSEPHSLGEQEFMQLFLTGYFWSLPSCVYSANCPAPYD